ncbi:MAG TPA: hypothetical protein PLQ76_08400 [bacterium]|nr:hypothetical protein [bacterium]
MIAYPLMIVLAFVSSLVIFLPSEIILLVLANIDKTPPVVLFGHELALAKYSTGFPWLLPVAATFGSNFGSCCHYLMGSGSLKLSGKFKEKLEGFNFEKLGKSRDVVIFTSCIMSVPPVSLTALAAGMTKFGLPRYYAISFAGKLIRYYIVLIGGRVAVDTILRFI